MKDWWKTFFNEDYVHLSQERGTFRHTRQEVNFLEKYALQKEDRILDLCCGHGRHSIELAKRGYEVTGLDFSSYELTLARKEAKRRGLNIDFRQGDARNFDFKQKFDVIINMFTAFGYGTRQDDRKIIHNVSRSLGRGGRFFIDLMNLAWLWRNFKRSKTEKLRDCRITYMRKFNFWTNHIEETNVIMQGKHKRIYEGSHHVYTLPEFSDLLASENLRTIRIWGSFRGAPYGLKSKRMIVLAKKVK